MCFLSVYSVFSMNCSPFRNVNTSFEQIFTDLSNGISEHYVLSLHNAWLGNRINEKTSKGAI